MTLKGLVLVWHTADIFDIFQRTERGKHLPSGFMRGKTSREISGGGEYVQEEMSGSRLTPWNTLLELRSLWIGNMIICPIIFPKIKFSVKMTQFFDRWWCDFCPLWSGVAPDDPFAQTENLSIRRRSNCSDLSSCQCWKLQVINNDRCSVAR